MAILPDKSIKKMIEDGSLRIDPYCSDFLGPNLYYCHLGNKFLLPKKNIAAVDPLTMGTEDIYDMIETNDPITMKAGGFLLAETFEFFGVDSTHVIKLMNSSSLARIGVSHAAMGMMNPGCGMKKPVKLTLELVNNAPFDVILTPTTVNEKGGVTWGTEVLKIAVQTMESEPDVAYDDWKYAAYSTDQGPSGPKMKNRFGADGEFRLPGDSQHLQ